MMNEVVTPPLGVTGRDPSASARPWRAEVLNMRSTPTAWALLAGSAVMAVASCIANLVSIEPDDLASPESLRVAMHASTVATLVFAQIAGVISSTTDFRHGRIDQLLLTQPSRSRLLAVKAGVGAMTGLVYGIVGSLAAVAATASFYAYRDTPLSLTSADVVRPLVGVIVGAALFAAIGIGVGTAIRNQPTSLAATLVFLLIVEPTLLLGLPSVGKWLPGASGLALTNSPDPNLVGQLTGAILLTAWAVVIIEVARRRFAAADL